MNTEKLFQELSSFYPISQDFKHAVSSKLIPLSLPRNHLLVEQPKVSDHIYYINEGSAMCFSYRDDKKKIEWLWRANNIVISPKSFFEQKPSEEFIQLLEHSELLAISHANVLELFNAHPDAYFIYRKIMNKYYALSRERIRDMQDLNGAERYTKLIKSFRNVELLMSQEHIASYLGLTPQSLSRIKRSSH
ncbi:Crp/Fnr family transcriptional regulator [Pseudochryseolinea flava]|uniref:Crp/Fnr family transcriptional regulator n=1 Tax=Pseudochryseolinea flava TaxID=2059302 RepID=A0A364Y486_9BACT|nr:Crp/Fnr family transcriptional regulator [Pseudochryseolinea flava]RAW01576.1 hypothetical protein DQQ10_07915 [Pseudochryseolinea flava]